MSTIDASILMLYNDNARCVENNVFQKRRNLMKKLIAIILSVALVFAVPVTCFAAGDGEITGTAAKVNDLASSLLDDIAAEAADLTVDGGQDLDAVVAQSFKDLDVKGAQSSGGAAIAGKAGVSSKAQTLKAASESYAKYLFIPVEDASEVASIIAESCEFTYSVVSDGKGTVYIKVNVEENPEIFNFAVFHDLVDQLYAGQQEEMVKNDDGSTDYLMSYEHIAAELALHMLVYAATSEIIKLSGSGSDTILSLYNSAKLAELNYDESRFPSKWIAALGRLIVTLFRFDIYRIFGGIA